MAAPTFELDPLYDMIVEARTNPDVWPEPVMAEMAKTASPLCLALSVDPKLLPYIHVRLMDAYLRALFNLQLYPDGPGGICDVWVRDIEGQGEFRFVGSGLEVALSDEVFLADEVRYVREGTGADAERTDVVVHNLALAYPPRHGKSALITENLPFWFLAQYPQAPVLVATYSADAAEKWGASTKSRLPVLEGAWPIASDGRPLKANNVTNSNISFREGKDSGEVNYRGVGGAITSTGFVLGIIDDPFKDASDALSAADREAKKDWYTAVFDTRPTPMKGMPPPSQVMMFTRWHEEDLAGVFALEEDGETPKPGWCVLRVPALAEPGGDDPLNREPGQSLCPQMASKAYLEKRQESDPVWFSCLYQGVPSHAKGNFFKKTYMPSLAEGSIATYHRYRWDPIAGLYRGPGLAVVDANAESTVHFMVLDMATSKRTTADWTVFTNWAFDPWTNRLVLVDCHRDRISSEKHHDELKMFIDRQPQVAQPMVIGIENKTFGTGLINELRRDEPTWAIVPLQADKDKITRATPYAAAVGAGKVWFPEPLLVPWVVKWDNEYANFPKGTHDDQVDCGSYAWSHSKNYLRPGERPPDQEADPLPERTHVQKGMATIRRNGGKREKAHPFTQMMDRIGAR